MYNAPALYDYLNAGKMYIKHRWDLGVLYFLLSSLSANICRRNCHFSRPLQVERRWLGLIRQKRVIMKRLEAVFNAI